MSDRTPLLDLPYIMPSQAQKHITHNAALRILDGVVQLAVLSDGLTTPPGSPAEGDRHIIAAGAAGAWTGRAGEVALWQDGAWNFAAPHAGWLAWLQSEGRLLAFDGTAWGPAAVATVNPAALVGVNATADATNRLSVKSDAVLLSHDDVTPGTGDIRVVLNKAAAGGTASLLLQDGFSGRAEIGLAGDDRLHVKTSPDGSAWTESMVVDAATGWIGVGTAAPEGPLHIFRSANVHPINERTDNVTGAPQMTARKARSNGSGGLVAVATNDVIQNFFGQGYDGSSYIGCANLRWVVDGTVSTGSVPTTAQVFTFTPGVGHTSKVEIKSNGTLRPAADNAYSCGDSTNRWSSLWAANGVIQTSDAREKNVVGRLPFAAAMVDAVEPVLFRWKVGGTDVVGIAEPITTDDDDQARGIAEVRRPGLRVHAGLLAQELKSAMDRAQVDFGAWGLADKDDPQSKQWTRPDQLVAVLWAALKQTRSELAELRRSINPA